MPEKKKWGKPKLFVLTRGDIGERVLESCKRHGEEGVPASVFGNCKSWVDAGCGQCSLLASS